jgi:hypothetical protein
MSIIKFIIPAMLIVFLGCNSYEMATPKTDSRGNPCPRIQDIKTFFDSCSAPYETIDEVMEKNKNPNDGIDALKEKAEEKCGDAVLITKQDKISTTNFMTWPMPSEEFVFTAKIIKFK